VKTEKMLDDFWRAFQVIMDQAAVELGEFMGMPFVDPVTEEQMDTAIREIDRVYHEENPDMMPDEEEPREEIMAELRAQAYEELWDKVFSPRLTKPLKRAQMIDFIESQIGRPLPLTEPPPRIVPFE
jgi:hypothetical protein